MTSECNLPRHMRTPGEDGYRTPTIEDSERTLSILGTIEESPGGGVGEAHSSALEAALQRASSQVTVKTKPDKEAGPCREYNGLGLFGLKRTVSGELSWKKRIRHVTWAYFTLTMATGGLANVLYQGLHGRSHAVRLNMANKDQFHFGLRAWIRLASLSFWSMLLCISSSGLFFLFGSIIIRIRSRHPSCTQQSHSSCPHL